MPWRPLNREQAWLLPPSVAELVADDHPARMVAAFVDQLSAEEWNELGVELEGQRLGSPAYHPRALFSVWLYGFMSGLRSSRSLERACREQLPYLYLTAGQRPAWSWSTGRCRRSTGPRSRVRRPTGAR